MDATQPVSAGIVRSLRVSLLVAVLCLASQAMGILSLSPVASYLQSDLKEHDHGGSCTV